MTPFESKHRKTPSVQFFVSFFQFIWATSLTVHTSSWIVTSLRLRLPPVSHDVVRSRVKRLTPQAVISPIWTKSRRLVQHCCLTHGLIMSSYLTLCFCSWTQMNITPVNIWNLLRCFSFVHLSSSRSEFSSFLFQYEGSREPTVGDVLNVDTSSFWESHAQIVC